MIDKQYIRKYSPRPSCIPYALVESRGQFRPDVEPLPRATQAGLGPGRSSVRCCVVQQGQLSIGFDNGTDHKQRKLNKPTGPTRTRA